MFDETHWLPKMYEFCGLSECHRESLIEIFLRTCHHNGRPVVDLGRKQLEALLPGHDYLTIREFADAVGRHFATVAGKELWADKCPDYGFFMQPLASIWPECRFVHIIRDGVDAALSMSKHPGFRWVVTAHEASWCSVAFNNYHRVLEAEDQPITRYVSYWHRAVTRIQDEATRLPAGRYLEVRYEDLLLEPEYTLTHVRDFVGLPKDQQWLEQCASIPKPMPQKAGRQEVLDAVRPRERELLAALDYL